MNPDSSGSGHIARNVRLSLVAIDTVQPYVCFSRAELLLGDHVHHQHSKQYKARVRTAPRRGLAQANGGTTNSVSNTRAVTRGLDSITPTSHTSTAASSTDITAQVLKLQWYIGGSYVIDATWLSLHSITDDMGHNYDSLKGDFTSYLNTIKPPLKSSSIASKGNTISSSNGGIAKHSNMFVNVSHVQSLSKVAPGIRYDTSVEQPYLFTTHVQLTADFKSNTTYHTNTHTYHTKHTTAAATSTTDTVPAVPFTSHSASDGLTSSHQHLATLHTPGVYWLVAWAVVDQHWGTAGRGYPSSTSPQSYLAKGRTDEDFYFTLNTTSTTTNTTTAANKNNRTKSIKGRKYWPSDPIVVHVHSNGSITYDNIILRCRWWHNAKDSVHDHSTYTNLSPITTPQPHTPAATNNSTIHILLYFSITMIILFIIYNAMSCIRRRKWQRRVREIRPHGGKGLRVEEGEGLLEA